jgi:hypothetical protein
MAPAQTPPQSPVQSYLQSTAGSTPRRPKLAHSHGSQSGRLDDARADLAKDAGWIPVVSFQDFQQHVLPIVNNDGLKLDDSSVQHILECCLSEVVIQPDPVGRGRWKVFPKDPQDHSANETSVYTSLQSIWDDIVRIVVREFSVEPVTRMVIMPNKPQASERPASTRPDAVLELLKHTTVTAPISSKEGILCWENTTTTMEFKKADKPDTFLDVRSNQTCYPRV